MVFGLTPRTEEAPPDPGSQILPTPGQTPLGVAPDDNVRLDDVAAPVTADDSETSIEVRITVAVASGSAVRRRSMRPFSNPFISTPEHLVIGTFNQ
jgi:hypothetical protein